MRESQMEKCQEGIRQPKGVGSAQGWGCLVRSNTLVKEAMFSHRTQRIMWGS